jgi:phospholipase/lecithinase/hemolysin
VNAQSSGPAYQVRGVFTNYAVGGARARTVSGGVNLGAQVQTYLNDFGGIAKASSTFVIFIGGNDIRDALGDSQNVSTILSAAVGAVANAVEVLYSAGARKFVVVYVPDLGLVPAVRMLGQQAQAGATFLSAAYNTGLGQAIAQLSGLPYINIASVDLFSDLQDVVANPASYGLTDTTDMCITPGVKGNAKCNNPNDYLFWDGIHPTSAGHAIIAEFIGPAL